jgi:hypothetical protein
MRAAYDKLFIVLIATSMPVWSEVLWDDGRHEDLDGG